MLTGHDIVYCAQGTWDGLWRSRQQLMSVFARQNQVLYVEGRPTARNALQHLLGRHRARRERRVPSIRRASERLFVLRFPMWAPESDHFPFNRLSRTIGRLYMRAALQKLQMSRPIAWFSQPSMVGLVEAIPSACLRVYHMYDEYSAYGSQTALDQQRIWEQEKHLIRLMDMVIAVSQKLYDAKRCLNPHTYLVPHGVNYQAYLDALHDDVTPDSLRTIRAPRLGYVGLISDKVDLNMLKELARNHPEWSFVFVGEARVTSQVGAWQALLAMPNVHYLGQVEVSQVPYYVKGFDVGLVPYVLNRFAENAQPLKLFDYLAAGIPVASVDVPAVREYRQYIHLAPGPGDFAQAVRAALSDTTFERCQARRDLAAQHTWEVRAEQISNLLETHLLPTGQKARAVCDHTAT